MVKKTLLALAVILIIIQFFRPKKNDSGDTTRSISTLYTVPPHVDSILRKACYDCHSNKTRYPWYAYVQPVGWWLAGHIRDGKRHLNFDEFAGARIARQYQRLEDCRKEVEEGDMPLGSYTIIHHDARLTDTEKEDLTSWFQQVRDEIKAKYPADSLVLPKQNNSKK